MDCSAKIFVFVAVFFASAFAYGQTAIGEKKQEVKHVPVEVAKSDTSGKKAEKARINVVFAKEERKAQQKYDLSLYLRRYEAHIKISSFHKSHLRQTSNEKEKAAVVAGLKELSKISAICADNYEADLTAMLEQDKSELGKKRLRLHLVALNLAKKQHARSILKKDIAGSTPEMNALKPLIRLYYPYNSADAISVFWRESSGLPYELNHGGCLDFGVTQINLRWQKLVMQKYGLTLYDLYDPVINVAFSRIVYSNWKCSFRPWVAAKKIGIH
ncbi:MAG: hypothetical protein UT66_C0020G0013 [candidate division CPR2 bacterium GW2011_GWC1_39_9]|uniref:Transglycosylase SLT domain-containing protein n=1 Tax=candidate division CPR2 bacterium GW2011_GWC2_39_10 TaxID=1618345 RepID=A0A0G0M385_UNCC2|nr:MAG: hypothetical protein UT18_C0007G0076 [candidate division CPR2 bacterium GW2011_GWC2_39_10]KKR34580.1 MAG: hypothetical protein UT66_C0020G0013 [candidate division CPR2 bacterium GW2011_GWC1_39_9]